LVPHNKVRTGSSREYLDVRRKGREAGEEFTVRSVITFTLHKILC